MVFERTPVYFVTTCTNLRRKILDRPYLNERLTQFAESGPTHGAWLGAYVLMPDHAHLFVTFDGQTLSLSEWMKSLKNTLSKALRDTGVASPHWQKGYFDHVLRSAESYSEKWEYVRNNPVRAGLVSRWQDWPYLGEPFALEYLRDRV